LALVAVTTATLDGMTIPVTLALGAGLDEVLDV